MGQMSVLNKSGDTKFEWNPAVPAEVEEARRTFQGYVDRRFAAFRVVGNDWRQGAQVREFDPQAERIIFMPAVAGG